MISNAGINLTGYHPQAPQDFCSEMCVQPQGFCTTKNARGQANVRGTGHLHQLAYKHGKLKIKLSECHREPGKHGPEDSERHIKLHICSRPID